MTDSQLLDTLTSLRSSVQVDAQRRIDSWSSISTRQTALPSVNNLANYLALRHHDLRDVQEELAMRGLTSLGQIEPHVMETLDALIVTIAAITGVPTTVQRPSREAFVEGRHHLIANTDLLFGPTHSSYVTRMMVTVPEEAFDKPEFFANLLQRGTHSFRINCAHGTPEMWERMTQSIRSAERTTHRTSRILMDLPGPKIRTATVSCVLGRERVVPGDRIHLVRPGTQHSPDAICTAECALPEVIDQVAIGADVWIDDGSVATVVERQTDQGLLLLVTRAPHGGKKIREAQGINTPNTDLALDPLTAEDLASLDHIVELADMVGYSFVQTADDIERLHDEIDARTTRDLAVIAKIETRRAVQNLPDIIVHSMARRRLGVMIARGDLAVELGFERITEMQEEIMWLCEAAHTPVIWATQVLESYVKKGLPTRAEMTDAAMSSRAECVMLNKGPFIADAVTILDHVLGRMATHFDKKAARLRELRSW